MAFDDTATVSGSVVSISDGADEVGAKSCVVTVRPTLSGVSSVTETQTGKNLLVNNIEEGATGGITYTKNSDGSISCSGTVSNVNSTRLIGTQVLPIGSYILSGADSSINLRAVLYDSNGSVITNRNDTGSGVTISVDSTVSYIEIRIKARTNAEQVSTTISPMLAVGSTVQTYEKYNGATHTANLGRTIHGGQVDIVNGVGTEEYTNTSLADKNYYYSSSLKRFDCDLDGVISSGYMDDFIPPQGYTIDHALIIDGANAPDYTMCIFRGKLFIKNLSCSSVSELVSDMSGKYITYSLATPIDFTFTGQEINTRLGYNAFWSEQGNTELTYYKSGYGFTSVTVHKETPDGEPVVQTVKFHRIVYGGQADVVRGICEPKNLFDLGTSPSDYEDASKISSVSGNVVSMTIIGSGSTYTYRKQDITIKGVVTLSMKTSVHYSRFLVKFRSADNTRWLTNSDITISETGWTYNQYYNGWFIQTSDTTVVRTITIPDCLYWRLGIGYASNAADIGSVETLSEIMLEKGSSASEYAPHFEPFTFPPISMGTDEGENTLFTNEGDSSITYRKAVD